MVLFWISRVLCVRDVIDDVLVLVGYGLRYKLNYVYFMICVVIVVVCYIFDLLC